MGIVTWIILGFVAGALAKWFVPGMREDSWFKTIILGVLGGFLGGYLGTVFGLGSVDGFNLESVALATGGAALVLLASRAIAKLR